MASPEINPKAHNVSHVADLDISRIAPLDAPHHDLGAALVPYLMTRVAPRGLSFRREADSPI